MEGVLVTKMTIDCVKEKIIEVLSPKNNFQEIILNYENMYRLVFDIDRYIVDWGPDLKIVTQDAILELLNEGKIKIENKDGNIFYRICK